MKTAVRSYKRAFMLVWSGLRCILSTTMSYLAKALGMRDGTKYELILRRIAGTCFTFIMVVLAIFMAWDFCRVTYYRFILAHEYDKSYYDEQYISRFVRYYTCYDKPGFIKTKDGKKSITNISWISKPLGMDSLVCYSDGNKRGYFNMFTGEPVIKPKYRHAWVFSDGLASVDDKGWIKFIDAKDRVVLDPKIPYIPGIEGYVFHEGYCVVHNDRRDRFGLIDKQGNWVLEPIYSSIIPKKRFWIVDDGIGQCLLDSTLTEVIPHTKGVIQIYDGNIVVTLQNHIIHRYSLTGELISDFYISSINTLMYETDVVSYAETNKDCSTIEGDDSQKKSDPLIVEAIAKCRSYEAEEGWYGLITREGRIITPPSYVNIKAIGFDLYFCEEDSGLGVILNGSGQLIS